MKGGIGPEVEDDLRRTGACGLRLARCVAVERGGGHELDDLESVSPAGPVALLMLQKVCRRGENAVEALALGGVFRSSNRSTVTLDKAGDISLCAFDDLPRGVALAVACAKEVTHRMVLVLDNRQLLPDRRFGP